MSICLRRREFITLLSGAAAWPLAAGAQQREMPVIGILTSPNPTSGGAAYFRQALAKAGYVVGQNVKIEFRSAKDSSLLPRLAADLVRRQMAVIVTNGGSATFAAKAATSTIPIVFVTGADGELRPRREPQPTRRQYDRSGHAHHGARR
jgi:putative ABC transport system substrate-binding protein